MNNIVSDAESSPEAIDSRVTSAPNIISRNVNEISGSILLLCSYTPSIAPAFINGLLKGRSIYIFCPELCHLDVLGLKMTTVFRLNRVTDVTVVTKDGSPHSIQIPFMVQEAAENAGFPKAKITYHALEGGKAHSISDLSIRKARHYSEIERLLPFAKLQRVTEILRAPGGCPNDAKETYLTVIDHLKEEVEEIAEAVSKNDVENMAEEVGDVLFNLYLICDIAKDLGLFSMEEVANKVADKMVAKHEFVFVDRKWKY